MKLNGSIIIVKIIAIKLPLFAKCIASYPLFVFSNSWLGKMPSSVDVSGQPRNVVGIKSINVWVMAIDVMNVIVYIGLKYIDVVIDINRAPIRFMWIPGIRPVIVPARIPIMMEIRISINIKKNIFLAYYF